jgi:ribokinase
MNRIIVIGSSNTDMVIKTEKLPAPGETILGGTFLMNPGGKGANQAVAAARLGGNVAFLTKIGNDLFGSQAVGSLMRENIDTHYIVNDPEFPSGVALITVDSKGENSIVVAPGSNARLHVEDIPSEIFETASFKILLLQLEIPINIVEYSAVMASEHGIKVILNPAPACKLSDNLLEHVWMITPNEIEAEAISGKQITDIASVEKAAELIQERGVKNVIITLGETGAFVKAENYTRLIPGIKVSPVDTTAAGDVFNGALAVALSEGMDLYEAIVFANKAASISVTRMGAQASAPYRNEIIS